MNIVLLKKVLSYLYEIPVETVISKYSGHMTVLMKNGRYQLCTDHAIYSYEDRYDNFLKAFRRIDRQKFFPSTVLILGFGLGSIPIIMEKLQFPGLRFTAVDIDEEVFLLANAYSLPKIKSPVEMITADAADFVSQVQQRWDLIISDIFIDDIIPSKFRETGYLRDLERLLSPGGMLMYNTLAFNDGDRTASSSFFENTFRNVYPDGLLLEVAHNYILANRKEFFGR